MNPIHAAGLTPSWSSRSRTSDSISACATQRPGRRSSTASRRSTTTCLLSRSLNRLPMRPAAAATCARARSRLRSRSPGRSALPRGGRVAASTAGNATLGAQMCRAGTSLAAAAASPQRCGAHLMRALLSESPPTRLRTTRSRARR